MSQPESNSDRPRGVLVRKPQTSVYTVLLFIALMALVISSAIMAWEMLQYDLQYNPSASLHSPDSATVAYNRLV